MSAKRYTLVLADGFEDTFARKDAAVRAGAKSGQAYQILSPSGQLVHEEKVDYVNDAPAEEPVVKEAPAEEPVVEEDEDLIGEHEADWVEKSRTFPGNYSISMIPFAQSIAEGYGGLSTSWKKTDGLARLFTVEGPDGHVKEYLRILDEASKQVIVDLRAWQKEHIAERRGLTDMQKFLQHRAFIEDFGVELGKRLAAEGKK